MEKKKKTGILLGGILLILIAVIVVLLFLLLSGRRQEGTADKPQGYVMEEGNYQQIIEEIEDNVRDGYFETYMNTTWTFHDGTAETEDAVFGNSPNNTKPIRCDVVLENTGEVVFATGVIPVGALLSAFKLDVALEAGKYDAVCMVYLLDELEDGTYQEYSSAGFNVTIVVEN